MPRIASRRVSSPYTRRAMETGTLGERRQADADALYAEAKQVLSQSANQLRAVTERLRQIGDDDAAFQPDADAAAGTARARDASDGMAHDAARLGRLEVVVLELERNWRFLERGGRGDWTASQRAAADEPEFDSPRGGPQAMQLLEAREAERMAIAAELHDGPAQALSNAVLQVDIVERAMRTDAAAARAELLTLRSELDRELERMRGFIHQLHPALQGDDDLSQAIMELAQGLSRDSGIHVDVTLEAPTDMLDAMRSRVVLRVVQEALRNVRKHAGATRVRVSTYLQAPEQSDQDQQWNLNIADNGRGFPVNEVLDHTSKRHFGLRFMSERAQLIGGRLAITSDPSTGTVIRLALPPAKRR
jgi:signal transduction histidine kinase